MHYSGMVSFRSSIAARRSTRLHDSDVRGPPPLEPHPSRAHRESRDLVAIAALAALQTAYTYVPRFHVWFGSVPLALAR